MKAAGKIVLLTIVSPVNRDRLVERDIKAACDKSGRTSVRAAVRRSWAGHRRDTGRPQKTKPLKFLALPRGLRHFSLINGLQNSGTPNRSTDPLGFLRQVSHQNMLRLGLRLRSVVTRAVAPLGHELVELGPVLGKA
jgi:hypothetical protein